MQVDLSVLYAAPKTFVTSPKWKFRDSEWMVLSVPLDIAGVTVEGLSFRATAMRLRPDENVTFQLLYAPPNGKPKPFARLEWNPLRPHNNKMVGPVEYRNVQQLGTHIHDFVLNWNHSKSGVRNGLLPISTPVMLDLSYDEIVAFVSKEFKIYNLNSLPKPDWSEILF
jgi:hypothetical protein